MRLFRLFAICAVAASTVVGFGASPANAGELCEQVQVGGSLVTPWGSPAYSYCQPYTGTFCQGQGAALDTRLVANAYVCVPDPFAP